MGSIKERGHGCISLSGSSPAYGVTLPGGTSASGDLAGNAWGSDVVGWISFNCNAGGPTQNNVCATTNNYKVTFTTTAQPSSPLTITSFYANPTRMRKGNTSTLYYTVASPPASCSITGSNGFSTTVSPVDGVQGIIATNAISSNTSFTITCGSVSASVIVDIDPIYQEL